MRDYVTKDSGERRDFGTGSVRDTNAGKPRFDLIPIAPLKRWAGLMARGAEKYGERNWELGQAMSRFEESALRHLYQYLDGDREEDHLAAVLFNVGGIMHHEEEIAAGRLRAELDDRAVALAPVQVDLEACRTGYPVSPQSCYFPGSGRGPSQHIEFASGAPAECVGCGITKAEAHAVGHDYLAS